MCLEGLTAVSCGLYNKFFSSVLISLSAHPGCSAVVWPQPTICGPLTACNSQGNRSIYLISFFWIRHISKVLALSHVGIMNMFYSYDTVVFIAHRPLTWLSIAGVYLILNEKPLMERPRRNWSDVFNPHSINHVFVDNIWTVSLEVCTISVERMFCFKRLKVIYVFLWMLYNAFIFRLKIS